jgi:hypothetical protein
LFYSLAYGVTSHLSLGVDYRPISDDWGLNGNFRIVEEGGMNPAIILGTATDDFGDITSQSYSAVASKRLFEWNGITVAPYAGGVYIDKLDDLRPVGGIYTRWNNKISVMAMYSGVDPHLVATYIFDAFTFSGVLFNLEDAMPGIAISTSF